jgi:hypothetical protein
MPKGCQSTAHQQEKIDKAKEAIRNLEWALKATLELRLGNLADAATIHC